MRIKKQKKALALLRDKYQQDRGRGAVITIGHVEYGTLPEDIPAKVKMEDGYTLEEAELAKLVAYLQLQARSSATARLDPQAPALPADASPVKRAPPAAATQASERSTAALTSRLRACVPAARSLRTWYVRVRGALQHWCRQAARR